MDLLSLGKKCVLESMRALENASSEIIQFKGQTKNIQLKADLEAEEAIINILKDSGKEFLIISEENGLAKIGENPEIEVYIDPLDGSSYFLVGNKRLCSTALMFVSQGKALASFVGDLMTGDIYHCDENFAYFNERKIIFSPEKKGNRYMVGAYAAKGKRFKEELPKLADLAQEDIIVSVNTGNLDQAQIATGEFDAVVDLLPINLWEYCGTAIAQKAGALVTTKEGESFQYKNIKQTCLTARNKEIQEMLLRAFK